jgi:outer membrane immunogenic protein
MKRILFVGAFALALGGQALAADLPPPPGPAPKAPAVYLPPAPVFSWTGIYLGVNGGYGFGTSNWTSAAGSTGNFNVNGGLVGGTLGGNYQFNSFVVGLEADLDWANLSGSSSACAAAPGAAGLVSCQTSQSWLGTARGRAGFAWDRALFYGTGGAAFGNIKAATALDSATNTEFGWTAGGGVEFAFLPNLTGKVEYLYVSLQNGSCGSICTATLGSPSVSLKENLIRAGVNYKFNFW